MKQQEPLILTSPEPINDGGKKYDCIYWILGIGFAMYGGVTVGIHLFALFLLLGMGMGWLVKSLILKQSIHYIRLIEFAVEHKVSNEELMIRLVPTLTALGMTVEKSKNENGYPVIYYQKNIYNMVYNEQKNVFSIYHSQNLARILLRVDYIGRYRKVSIATGMIAYYIQQIYQGSMEGTTSQEVHSTSGTMKFCPSCGNELVEGVKFCSNCGSTIGIQNQVGKSQEWQVPTNIQQVGNQSQEKEKKRKKIVRIVIGISVLLMVFSLFAGTGEGNQEYVSNKMEGEELLPYLRMPEDEYLQLKGYEKTEMAAYPEGRFEVICIEGIVAVLSIKETTSHNMLMGLSVGSSLEDWDEIIVNYSCYGTSERDGNTIYYYHDSDNNCDLLLTISQSNEVLEIMYSLLDDEIFGESDNLGLSGQWYNVGSGRAKMSIEEIGNNQLQMEINWSGGAAYMSVWTMDGQYVYDELNEYWKIEYSNCRVVEQEYGDDGEVAIEEVLQEGGTGYFYLDRNNLLVWVEDTSAGDVKEVFAQVGTVAVLYTMEFVAWDDEYEMIIIVDYYESFDGGKMIMSQQTSDNWGEWITGEFSFEEVSSGEGNRYHIYDEAGSYIQADFETSIDEYSGADILILYDMETGAELTLLEKTYAYGNVG